MPSVENLHEFFCKDRRKSHPNSMGLGLPVSRKLARLMGGDLRDAYRDGRSCFVVYLPLG